jgi:hypothetical protein
MTKIRLNLGAVLVLVAGLLCILPFVASTTTTTPLRQVQGKFVGTSISQFGTSVAVSRDGSLAVVGAPSALDEVGTVYTFRFNKANREWQAIDGNETVSDPTGLGQGDSIALSADGSTLVVGAPDDGPEFEGLVRVYSHSTRPSSIGVWSLQQILSNPGNQVDGGFGISLGLSDDGRTLAVGAVDDAGSVGGAFVYTRESNTSDFQQVGPKLVGTGAEDNSNQGYAVAVSGDGRYIALGGPDDASGRGAVWVFVLESDRFRQLSKKLLPNEDSDNFGFSLALSAQGDILLVGAPFHFPRGAVFVYRINDGATGYDQIQQLNVLSQDDCSTNCMFGFSVSISSEGNKFVAGAPFHTIAGAGMVGNAFLFERDAAIGDEFALAQNLTGTLQTTENTAAAPTVIGQDVEVNPDTRLVNQGFSVSMTANGSVILVGAPEEGLGSEGAVRFFQHVNTPTRRPRLLRQNAFRGLSSPMLPSVEPSIPEINPHSNDVNHLGSERTRLKRSVRMVKKLLTAFRR